MAAGEQRRGARIFQPVYNPRSCFQLKVRVMRRRLAACVLFLSVSPFVLAQDFPSHPIKVIVPQPPGGGFDLVGRVNWPTSSRLSWAFR